VSVVTLAIVIVAAFAAGGAYFGASRVGAGAWLAFTLGLVVYGVIYGLAPLVIP